MPILNFHKTTIVGMFPAIFEQTAQVRNDIDWAASLKGSPDLQRFVYRKLIEEQNEMAELIDRDNLKSELDAFFAVSSSSSPGLTARAKASAGKLLGKTPAALDLVHGSAYALNKWRGKLRDSLPTEKLVMQMMILKVWMDLFLHYPSAKTSTVGG